MEDTDVLKTNRGYRIQPSFGEVMQRQGISLFNWAIISGGDVAARRGKTRRISAQINGRKESGIYTDLLQEKLNPIVLLYYARSAAARNHESSYQGPIYFYFKTKATSLAYVPDSWCAFHIKRIATITQMVLIDWPKYPEVDFR